MRTVRSAGEVSMSRKKSAEMRLAENNTVGGEHPLLPTAILIDSFSHQRGSRERKM